MASLSLRVHLLLLLGRHGAIRTRSLKPGAERAVRRERVALLCAQLLLLKPQCGAAAKPKR